MPTKEASKVPLIGVIDSGTRTIKFSVFKSRQNKEFIKSSEEIQTSTPQEGWYEQDPMEILSLIRSCIENGMQQLKSSGFNKEDIATIGITNQRETIVVWDKRTGKPLYNAIMWSDVRSNSVIEEILAKVPDNNKNYFRPTCGLPISPLFSAFKLKWLMQNVPKVGKACKHKTCLFGTVDSWIVWNLTGGVKGGLHITDVTNASRTFLMNLETLHWDPSILHNFNIPIEILPEIRSSSEIYGRIAEEPLNDLTISSILGNQQAALLGQHCFKPGQAKNSYRSGCFLLYNTGHTKVHSPHGLVTTVAYKLGNSRPVYALEGSVAVAGAALDWLKNNMGILDNTTEDSEALALAVSSTGDVYFVPAFEGLYAPYWRTDARGIICGITAYTTKRHIIRAALEAICFQTRDILEAMKKDCGIPLAELRVDGTIASSNLIMQLQADINGLPVLRSRETGLTALGGAIAAGQAEGINVWDFEEESREVVNCDTFLATTTEDERDARYTKWKMAVQRSLGWVIPKRAAMTEERYKQLSSVPISLYLISSFGLLLLAETLDEAVKLT